MAIIGDGRMKNEGTILIKAISVGDVREYRAQIGLCEGQFVGAFTKNSAERHHQNFVRSVSTRHPAQSRAGSPGTKAVDRTHVIDHLGTRQNRVKQDSSVI